MQGGRNAFTAAALERWLVRGLSIAACVFGAVGAVAWALGGGVVRVGPVAIGLQRPARTVALAVALLLLRAVLRPSSARGSWWRGAVLVGLLAAALVADSKLRLVGDGHEYLAMAANLAAGQPPALTAEERRAVEAASSPLLDRGDLDAPVDGLVGADGRQDFLHFWAYPLLAAPFVAVLTAAGGPALHGFTLLNTLLLVAATAVVGRRCGPGAVVMLFAGPLLWWVDKPHPEVLLVATLAAALAIAPGRPDAALLLASLPAAQNPAFVPVLAVATAWAWSRSPRAPRLLLCTVVAWAVASVNPLYYLRHLGRTNPLGQTLMPHLPVPAEIWLLLGDSNLGLLGGWPAVGLALLASLVWGLVRLTQGGRRAWDSLAVCVAAGSLLLLSTQAANANHGGTRGVSRYALWLTPFVVPLLAHLGQRSAWRWRAGLAVLAGLSILSLFPEYVPSRPERFLQPTPLARWIWTRHPGLERPLPEVFAERTWGREATARAADGLDPGVVPAATRGCEKALVRGDGSPIGIWPLACTPAEKPEECRPPGVLCYADAGRDGRRFALAPAQAGFPAPVLIRWYWSGTPSEELARALHAARWADLGLVDPVDEGRFLGERSGIGRIQMQVAEGVWAVWFHRVRREDAWLEPRVQGPATALLVDPRDGREVGRQRIDPERPGRIPVPFLSPLLLVVIED